MPLGIKVVEKTFLPIDSSLVPLCGKTWKLQYVPFLARSHSRLQGLRQFPSAIENKDYFKIISMFDFCACIFSSKMTQEWMDGLLLDNMVDNMGSTYSLQGWGRRIQEMQEESKYRKNKE